MKIKYLLILLMLYLVACTPGTLDGKPKDTTEYLEKKAKTKEYLDRYKLQHRPRRMSQPYTNDTPPPSQKKHQ